MASVEPSRGVHSSHSDPPIAGRCDGNVGTADFGSISCSVESYKRGRVVCWLMVVGKADQWMYNLFVFFTLRKIIHRLYQIYVSCLNSLYFLLILLHTIPLAKDCSPSWLVLPIPNTPLFSDTCRSPWVSSEDKSRPFGRSNPSASRRKSLPKAVVVMRWCCWSCSCWWWEVDGEEFGCSLLEFQTICKGL